MRKTFSGEFKTKVVLEIFKEEKTISQIASEYALGYLTPAEVYYGNYTLKDFEKAP